MLKGANKKKKTNVAQGKKIATFNLKYLVQGCRGRSRFRSRLGCFCGMKVGKKACCVWRKITMQVLIPFVMEAATITISVENGLV